MNKRPLCVFALLFVLILFLMDVTGILSMEDASSVLPDGSGSKRLEAEGEILESDHNSYYTNLTIRHVKLIYRSKKIPIKGIKFKIKTEWLERIPEPGAKIRVSGKLRPIPDPPNPGQFHERNYYHARKIDWYMEGSSLELVKEPDFLKTLQNKGKAVLREELLKLAPADTGGLFCAMILGDKSMTDPEEKRLMEIEGISHIMAISGTHLSFLGWGVFFLLRRAGLSLKKSAVLSAFLMFQYGYFTGGSPSAMRAVIMFSLGVLALAAGRTYDLLSALATAAVLLLLDSPAYLYDCGFLLSFGAVLGLSLMYPAMKSDKKEKKIVKSLKSGLGLFLGLLPIQMYFFYELPLLGIFTNLFVLPTAGVILSSGFTGMWAGFFFPLLGRICMVPGAVLLRFYLFSGKLIRELPFAMCITGRPPLWKIFLYYLFLAGFIFLRTYRKQERQRKRAWFLLLPALCILLIRLPQQDLQVTFLDVGQGDCSVIRHGGRTYLLDGGSSSVSLVGTYRILPYLKEEGIREVDGIFLSHMDIDHINGIEELFHAIMKGETSLKVRNLYLSLGGDKEEKFRELAQLGEKAGCQVHYFFQGDKICWGEAELSCLYPYPEAEGDNNETSQVFLLTYEELQVLFTGDLEGRGEEAVTKLLQEEGIRAQVLKVAHHGSGNSTYEEFLEILQPQVGLISCGKENKYGHPHKELLNRLKKAGVQIFTTPEKGAMFLRAKGKRTELSFQYGETMVN